MKHKELWFISTIIGALSVILGAYGAHSLKNVIEQEQLNAYKTATFYQFIHSTILLFIAFIINFFDSNKILLISFYLFFAGIVLFCGSIYLLIVIHIPKIFALLTPLGGICFILAWISLLLYPVLKK